MKIQVPEIIKLEFKQWALPPESEKRSEGGGKTHRSKSVEEKNKTKQNNNNKIPTQFQEGIGTKTARDSYLG